MLAVQGPRSTEVLAELGLPTDMDYMGYADAYVLGRAGAGLPHRLHRRARLRTAAAVGVRGRGVRRAGRGGRAAGGEPAGLGARDTLRTEMGYPLHGHELSLDISPLQARCGWAIGWKKDAFFGRDALLAEKAAGPRRLLRGLRMVGRGVLRPGLTVLAGDTPVGVTTSGTFSPTLQVGIALALIDTDARNRRRPANHRRRPRPCRRVRSRASTLRRPENPLAVAPAGGKKPVARRYRIGAMTTGSLEFTVSRASNPATDAERESILAEPGFGKYFTDHMVSIDYADGQGWHDARVIAVRAD